MISVLSGVLARIISNSYLNVFQKKLTNYGSKPSVINFYTYLGLTVFCSVLIPWITLSYSNGLLFNFIVMGILGALGNYYIIKALSLGELSSLAPINSYKPIVALIVAFFYLHELPSIYAIFCPVGCKCHFGEFCRVSKFTICKQFKQKHAANNAE